MSAHKDVDFNNDANNQDLIVTIELDDGTDMDCLALTIFDVGEQDYIVLLPVDENGQPDEETDAVYIYRYFEDTEGNPSLDNIQSDEEYDKVSQRFDEIQAQL